VVPLYFHQDYIVIIWIENVWCTEDIVLIYV